MLRKLFAELMDFSENETNLIVDEFNHKFGGCWININGKPILIRQIDINFNIHTDFNLPEEIITIEPFMPQLGIYDDGRTISFIHRLPKRQFLKSYCPGQNYKTITLSSVHPLNIQLAEYKGIVYAKRNKAWMYNKEIGISVETNTETRIHLYPQYNSLINDLREICPNYSITSLEYQNLLYQDTTIPKPVNRKIKSKLML